MEQNNRKSEPEREKNKKTNMEVTSVKYCAVKIRDKMSSRRCKKEKINKQDSPAGQESQQNSEEEN